MIINKVITKIIDNFVFPLIVVIFLPTVVSVVSKFYTGNWFNYAKSIPRIYRIMFITIFCLWLLASIIYRRKKLVDELNSDSFIGFYVIPAYGWIKVGEIQYADLLWNIKVPAPSPWSDSESINTNRVEADTPPRCPKCKTEIEQSSSFWGGYIWQCVACGYRKKSKGSYYKEAKRVKKIAKRELEKQTDGLIQN